MSIAEHTLPALLPEGATEHGGMQAGMLETFFEVSVLFIIQSI
jgi:hypothetical protein